MNIYKATIPYIIMGAASLLSTDAAHAQSVSTADLPQSTTVALFDRPSSVADFAERMTYRVVRRERLAERAGKTTNQYIAYASQTRQELAPLRGKPGYKQAVRAALPGAPVGLHCMWGQYTELMRALEENGDTLTIVPKAGSRSCAAFKDHMRKKYGKPEYAGCIQEGRVFESDSAYNAALAQYLRRNGITDATTASEKRDMLAEKFAKTNFSAEQVAPGSIWIVPRYHGSKNKFHAIMFLGRGKVENGEFIPTPDGKFMYTGFNNESIGNVFNAYDMSNVFSASIEDILNVEYGKELQRLESLPTDQMIEYIVNGTNLNPADLRKMPRRQLLRLVRDKYFGAPQATPNRQPEQIAQADIPAAMLYNMQYDRS